MRRLGQPFPHLSHVDTDEVRSCTSVSLQELHERSGDLRLLRFVRDLEAEMGAEGAEIRQARIVEELRERPIDIRRTRVHHECSGDYSLRGVAEETDENLIAAVLPPGRRGARMPDGNRSDTGEVQEGATGTGGADAAAAAAAATEATAGGESAAEAAEEASAITKDDEAAEGGRGNDDLQGRDRSGTHAPGWGAMWTAFEKEQRSPAAL